MTAATITPAAGADGALDDGVLATLRGASAPVRALLVGVLLNRLGRFLQVYLVLFLTARGFSAPEAGLALGAYGAITGWVWGNLVQDLQQGERPWTLTVLLVLSLVTAPLLLAEAFKRYPQWWIAVMLRTRMAVLFGQTRQQRLPRTPPGEVVARSMDADRYARYADRWVDFLNGLVIVAITAAAGQSLLAGGVLLAVILFAPGGLVGILSRRRRQRA